MPDTPPTPEEASAEARGVFPHASLRDAASLAIDLATFPLHMCCGGTCRDLPAAVAHVRLVCNASRVAFWPPAMPETAVVLFRDSSLAVLPSDWAACARGSFPPMR